MKRRYFVLGGLALAAAGGVAAIQPRKHVSIPRGSGRLPNGHRVVVVGGGLAGLSAALELAERGAAVTLLEAAPHFGGKLGGWPVRMLGEDFAMEHGFHGFFSQYYNLTDVLRRLDALKRLAPALTYPIAFASGGEERFPATYRPFPFNLLSLYATSDRLRWQRMATAGPPMEAMLAYDAHKTYAALDGISFAEYARTLDPELVEAMLLPFAKTTLNLPEHTSAAHVLRFMHFYFLGNPEGLSYRYTLDDCMTNVINPWVERLRGLGVTLKTDTRVSSLAVEGGRVVGVNAGRSGSQQVLARAEGLDDKPKQVGVDDRGAPIFAWKGGALRGACTHQGCPVAISATGFDCPCHGGRFDFEGVPFAGPPKRPLERLRVLQDGAIVSDTASPDFIACDDVVMACDVRGTRQIVGASDLPREVKDRCAALAEADPYLVVRLWMDRPANPDRIGFYTTTGYELLDSIGLYDRLQDSYRDYAKRTGHGVVELHAYAIAHDQGMERNRDLIISELRRAMPELRDAKILDMIAMQQSNFSGFPVGSHAERPSTVGGENLYFAGDWVKTDVPVALMEGAVTTGRLAANAILGKHGAEEVAIASVAQHGVITR